MSEHFNGLTPGEAERLAMLAEECGEVVQMVCKILRHGYDSYNPNDSNKMPNKWLLSREINDLMSVIQQMSYQDGVGHSTLHDTYAAWEKKLKYSHHQVESNNG